MTEVAVTFTKDELWLLHAVIRHEDTNQKQMKFPTTSVELNDRIVEAILACEDSQLTEYSVELGRGDCLCIDANVRSDMKTAANVPIGKNILMKVFRARRRIAGGWEAEADEPPMTDESLSSRLSEWQETEAKKPRRRPSRKKQSAPSAQELADRFLKENLPEELYEEVKNAKSHSGPDDHPDHQP